MNPKSDFYYFIAYIILSGKDGRLRRHTYSPRSAKDPTEGAGAGSAGAREAGGKEDGGDNIDHYDSVMNWLNAQACGGTVKRKRKINKQQVNSSSVENIYNSEGCQISKRM